MQEFFEFFSSDYFDCQTNFINVSSDKIIEHRESYELSENFDIKQHLIEENTYIVRDPFNNTYNPARALKGEKNSFFQDECKKALNLLYKGKFII